MSFETNLYSWYGSDAKRQVTSEGEADNPDSVRDHLRVILEQLEGGLSDDDGRGYMCK